MDNIQRVLKNFISLAGAEFIARILGVSLSLYTARVLGVNAFGQLAFATAFISFFNIFSDFGLTTLGIKNIAKNTDEVRTIGSNIFVIQSLASTALVILLVAIVLFIPISTFLKIIVIIFGVGMIPTAFDMSYIFQAYETMHYISIARILSQIGYFLMGVILIILLHNVIAIPIASTISLFIGAWIAYYILKKKGLFSFEKVNWQTMKQLTIAAMPFLIGSILVGIYHNLDSVLLQFMKNSVQVGYYNAGYSVVNLIMVFTVFVANVFFPLLAKTFSTQLNEFSSHSLNLAKSMGFICIPLTFGGLVYAKQLISALYGSGFDPGADAFKILLFLIILISFNVVISNIIIAAELQNQNTISIAIGAVINLILNSILIPKYGISGAAVATICAESVVCLYLMILYSQKLHNIFSVISSFLFKPLIASLGMDLILVGFHIQNVFLGIVVGAIVYIGISYVTNNLPLGLIQSYFVNKKDVQ
jgi:O-antigen/teichoic acid export membrane protein